MQIDGIKGPLSTTLKIVTLFKGFASVPALFRAQTKLNTGTKQMPNQARKTSMLVGENSLTWLKNAAMKSTYKSEPCVKHLGHMGCPSETCSFPPKRGLLIGVLDSVTLKWRHSGPKVKMSLAWGETNLWGEWDSSSVSATNSQPSALLPTSPPPRHAADRDWDTPLLPFTSVDPKNKAVYQEMNERGFALFCVSVRVSVAMNSHPIQAP